MANDPTKIAISSQEYNYSREIIEKTLKFNLNVLTEEVPFDVIKHFGFQTGKNVNKFKDCTDIQRTSNGIIALKKYVNAVFSVEVKEMVKLGTHTLFIGDVVESKVISESPSVTYAYYHKNIKPKN